MLSLAGTSVRTPSLLRVGFSNIAKIEPNAAGLTLMDRLARKRRLEIEWAYLTNAQMKTIASNVTSPFFSVSYYDPETSAAKTITCRVENFETGMQRYTGSAAVGWQDIKLELVEQ